MVAIKRHGEKNRPGVVYKVDAGGFWYWDGQTLHRTYYDDDTDGLLRERTFLLLCTEPRVGSNANFKQSDPEEMQIRTATVKHIMSRAAEVEGAQRLRPVRCLLEPPYRDTTPACMIDFYAGRFCADGDEIMKGKIGGVSVPTMQEFIDTMDLPEDFFAKCMYNIGVTSFRFRIAFERKNERLLFSEDQWRKSHARAQKEIEEEEEKRRKNKRNGVSQSSSRLTAQAHGNKSQVGSNAYTNPWGMSGPTSKSQFSATTGVSHAMSGFTTRSFAFSNARSGTTANYRNASKRDYDSMTTGGASVPTTPLRRSESKPVPQVFEDVRSQFTNRTVTTSRAEEANPDDASYGTSAFTSVAEPDLNSWLDPLPHLTHR